MYFTYCFHESIIPEDGPAVKGLKFKTEGFCMPEEKQMKQGGNKFYE